MGAVKKRVLQPKVTTASVRRKWQDKYAELNERYESLCRNHRLLARAADDHRVAQELFREEARITQELATDRLVRIHQLEGVIIYLEGKLNGTEGKEE